MEEIDKASELFSLSDARAYFESILGHPRIEQESDAVNDLIVLLEHSALAIKLACSYIKQNNDITIAHYIALFKEKLPQLQLVGFQSPIVVAMAWALNYEKINDGLNDSVILIYGCSQLHNESIPCELLRRLFKSDDKFVEAIRIASVYSMILLDETGAMIYVPVSFQEIFCISIPEETILDAQDSAARLIVDLWSIKVDEAKEIKYKNIMLPHIKKLLSCFDEHQEKRQGGNSSHCFARMLILMEILRGEFLRSEDIQALLRVCQKICLLYKKLNDGDFGLEQIYLNALYGLMHAYQALENYIELADVCRKVLEVDNIDDSARVNVLTKLGAIQLEKSEMQEGLGFLEQAKDIEEGGLRRPDQLVRIYGALGEEYLRVGDFAGALEVLQRGWGICKKNNMLMSPIAGKIALNIGNCHPDHAESLALLGCALDIQAQHYGQKNSEVAEVLYAIAVRHFRMGQLAQALDNANLAYEMVLHYPGFGENHLFTQKNKLLIVIISSVRNLFALLEQRNESTDHVNFLFKEMAESFLRGKPEAAMACVEKINAMCGYSLEGCEKAVSSLVKNFEGENGRARVLGNLVKSLEEDPARQEQEDHLCEKQLDAALQDTQTEIEVYIQEGLNRYNKSEYAVALFLLEEALELMELFDINDEQKIHVVRTRIRQIQGEHVEVQRAAENNSTIPKPTRGPVEELHQEQLHYTVFQGSNHPKSKQFESFLSDILMFVKQHRMSEERIFFSYAWPKEKDDHKESWHTKFILFLKRHLSQGGLMISLDQDESIVAHNLNAFMQRIEQSDRVFVFGSQTRDEKLSWPKSGVVHENNLIMACEMRRSLNKPFVVHIGLSDKCKIEPDSKTLKNIPLVTDYLLLLKSLIAEAYGFGEEFEKYWQEKLKAHRMMDMLVRVPAQAPNCVKRTALLAELDQRLNSSNCVVCVGGKKTGKKQLCLSYVWDNYYRFSAVYWGMFESLRNRSIKSNALVVLVEPIRFAEMQPLLARNDIKIIIVSSEYLLLDDCEYLRVGELLPREAHALIENILADSLVSEREALIGCTELALEPLLRACGYIQRNRMTIPEYLFDFMQSREEILRLELKPIRERKVISSVKGEEEFVLGLKRRDKAPEFKSVSSNAVLNISDPPPEDSQKVKLRSEGLQRFCQSEGHHAFLDELKNEIAKLQLRAKTVFISFAVPPVSESEDAWTTVFVRGIADSFSRIGVEVFYLDSSFDLASYIEENRSRIDDIHVFIMSTRYRLKDPEMARHDAMVKKCQSQFAELLKPNQVFVMPIRLTSKKYYDKHYENYAAYSFYEHDYMEQLRDLTAFMFWLDGESVEQFWKESALRHKLESNWWPSRPAENSNFVGRKKALIDIQKHFRASQKLLVIAATGMGGVGKTYLARQFALLYGHKYSEVFWLKGGSRQELLQQYIALGMDKGLLNSEEDKRCSLEERAQTVINWMQNKPGWLLVIDNTTSEEVEGCLPSQGGKILITSPKTEWQGQDNISVKIFTLSEAREYFEKVLGREVVDRESESVNELIKLLGNLPLAIALTCAHLKQNYPMTVAEYLLLFKNALKVSGSHAALRATWSVTLDKLQKEYPSALDVLYLGTMLHHQSIPVNLIYAFFKNKVIADNAMRVAAEYSMVVVSSLDKSVSFHGLVQEILHTELAEEVRQRWQKNAIETMRSCYPDSDQLQALYARRALLPHLKKLLMHVEAHDEKTPWIVDSNYQEHCLFLMTLVASVSMRSDVISFQDSEELLKIGQKMLSVSELNKSADAKQCSKIAWLCIGAAYDRLGKPLEVIRVIFEHAIPLCETTDCVELVDMFCILANAYTNLGKQKERLHYLEKARQIAEKNPEKSYGLGKIYNGLCIVYGALGQYGKSLEYAQRVNQIFSVFYEAGHPAVAYARRELATCYLVLGNFEAAREELEEARKIQEKIYGENHIEVARILTILGQVYISLDNYEEAEKLLEKALRIKEQVLGGNHLDVANTLNSLSGLCLCRLDGRGARKLLERAWNIYKKSGRLDDRGAAKVAMNMAQTFITPANLTKRFKWLNRALTITIKCYDENHPEVAEVLHNFAIAYFLAGQYEKIPEIKSRIFKIFASHPDFGENSPKAQVFLSRCEAMETLCNLREVSTKDDVSGVEIKTLLKEALRHCQNNNDVEARNLLEQCLARCGTSEANKKTVSDLVSVMLNFLGGNDSHQGLISYLHSVNPEEEIEKDAAIKILKAFPSCVFETEGKKEEAIRKIQGEPDLKSKIIAFIREASEGYEKGEVLVASLLHEEALELCQQLPNSDLREELEGMICVHLGIFCCEVYEYAEVLGYLERALKIYERLDKQDEIPLIRRKIASVLLEIERSDRAAESGTVNETMRSILRSFGFEESIRQNIAALGEDENAEEILNSQDLREKALKNLTVKMKEKFLGFMREASEHFDQGEYLVARLLFEEALELSDFFAESEGAVADIHFNIGLICWKENEYTEARVCFDQALGTYQQLQAENQIQETQQMIWRVQRDAAKLQAPEHSSWSHTFGLWKDTVIIGAAAGAVVSLAYKAAQYFN